MGLLEEELVRLSRLNKSSVLRALDLAIRVLQDEHRDEIGGSNRPYVLEGIQKEILSLRAFREAVTRATSSNSSSSHMSSLKEEAEEDFPF